MTAEWKGPTLVVVWGRVGGRGWGGEVPISRRRSFMKKFLLHSTDELTQQDGKSHARDQRDKAITCVFCRDLH